MLRALTLKTNYSSEAENLYEDFFLPVLTQAVAYRRAVGFFSLGVLLNAPAAMSRIVESGGRAEIIFGKLVSAADFEAIRDGTLRPEADAAALPNFERLIAEHTGSLLEFRIRLLAWLFANGRLEMKVAIRPEGLFHQKIGLFEDAAGDTISFSGSMNETLSALDPRYNSEEIAVFKSWIPAQNEYLSNHRETFARLWSGETGSSTVICPVPEAIEEGLSLVAARFPDAPDPGEEDEKVRVFLRGRAQRLETRPSIPAEVHGQAFEIRKHQVAALREWSGNNHNGILELATGAGKTVTALYAAAKTLQANEGMVLLVAVPYQDLADQWCAELRQFNMHALRCYGSRSDWEPALQDYLRRNRGGQKELLTLVVVNRTLVTDHFQNYARQLDPSRLFFVGDECHHHGARGFVGKLLPGARFRMGLSATPFHYMDEEANARLREVYDRSVYQYTLGDAVGDGVLTPYEYAPVPVELTAAEAEDYVDLTDQIARIYASTRDDPAGAGGDRLRALLMRRARLVGAAANKMVALEALIVERAVEPFSLFYCSDGRVRLDEPTQDVDGDPLEATAEMKQRHAVAQMLLAKGIRVSPFTSDESRGQRREILNRFKTGETEALVAIRCLDEGIDVPACRTAYIIASSRNPRQFVQRRGRILRRADGKDRAKIFDFVVVMPDGPVAGDALAGDFLKAELGRVADFARHSLYPASSIKPLIPWLRRYDLEHLAA